jgi:hypothetical protein
MGKREMTDDKWQITNSHASRKEKSMVRSNAIESRPNVLRRRVIAAKIIRSEEGQIRLFFVCVFLSAHEQILRRARFLS